MNGGGCASARVGSRLVKAASEALFKVFVSEGKYGPVDKLGLASSRDAILAALFEVVRGVRSGGAGVGADELDSLSSIVDALADDLRRDDECLEEARRLVNLLAVRALAKHAREAGG